MAKAPASAALILGAGVIGRATAGLLRQIGLEVFAEDPDPAALDGFPGSTEPIPGAPEFICICVPTPATEAGMDTTAIEAALARSAVVAGGAARPPLVAVRSTLMPGMFRDLTRLLREASVPTCYWPCFARERSAEADELAPRTVVIGAESHESVQGALGSWLKTLECPVFLVSPEDAELAKAGANAFNALKISYFNALGDWANEQGATGATVAQAVVAAAEGLWNPAYGTRPGPAFGGACLPKDLDALIAALGAAGSPHADLLRAARDVNRSPLRQPSLDSGA